MQPKRIAHLVKKACEDKKAEDVVILDVRKLANFTRYFVIATGTSDRHVQGVSRHIVDELREKDVRAWHVEGERDGQWILLDYGDVIVHIFHYQMRHFYGLERLWGDAASVK
ncbi:MAG: ribosome silencing factor [Candidatus Omnitrophica bacterium]|nr:ribosome silencing factor [Candidatus Omnitrophota bacterium]